MQNDCICLRLQQILCRCDDIVYKGFHAKIVITNNGIQMLAFSNDMFNQRLDHAKVVVADNGIQMLAFPNDMFMQRLPCKRLMVQSKASMQMSLLPAMAYTCLRFPTICSNKGIHAKVAVANNGIQMHAFPNDMFNQRLPCKGRCCQQWHTNACVSQRYV